MAPRVGCTVVYSALERHFLEHVVRESVKFAYHVVVAYSDKLFDNTPQDHTEVDRVRQLFAGSNVSWVQYKLDPVDELMDAPSLKRREAYWNNRARWEALRVLDPSCEFVVITDADEVPEGDRMKRFVSANLPDIPGPDYPAMKLANYWYMRQPTLRSRVIEDSVVLVPRHRVTSRDSVMLCDQERNDLAYEPVLRRVADGGPTPMYHHYSWVRAPEDLIKKVRTWSHREDRNWEEVVNEELRRPIQHVGHVDVILHRTCDVVPGKFGIVMT
jgi:hypothetical protein